MPPISFRAIAIAFASELAADFVISMLVFRYFAGDLLGPDDGSEERLLGLQPQWEILEPARLLVLDAAFAQRIAAYPGLGAALVDRAHERARRTAIALALSHLPRVEDRLHRLLWHLADRRGRVSADGIVLSLPLAVGISALEIIVVLVQAYVFTLLTAVFIGMAIHVHH